MRVEIKEHVAKKYNNFPLLLQQSLLVKLNKMIDRPRQTGLSVEAVKSTLNCMDFAYKQGGGHENYLFIKYNPSLGDSVSMPEWKIVYRGKEDFGENERIDTILEWIFMVSQNMDPKYFQSASFSRCQEERIVFSRMNKKTISLPVRDIIFMCAEGDFTSVSHNHKKAGQTVLVDLNMGRVEAMMSRYCFYRIHRSYMVNLGCVRKISTINSIHHVVLCSGQVLPVARRRYSEIKEKFDSFTPECADHLYELLP